MFTFITITGSIYQVDADHKLVRRTYTTDQSGESQRISGDWRTYDVISDITVGESVIIVWSSGVETLNGSEQWVGMNTFTSPVVSVKENTSDEIN